MDFTLTFDAAYAAHAAVVMATVADVMPDDELRYWVVTADDVNQRARAVLDRAAGPNATISYLDVDATRLSKSIGCDPVMMQYLSPAMYLRLLVPEALPSQVERVLYMDCDVLCTDTLKPLFELDMGGVPIGAVRDAFNRRLLDMGGLPGMMSYGMDPRASYFNSGVLLIDVPAWKAAGVTERSISYLDRHAQESRYPDQDALNFAVYGNWLRLSRRWNDVMGWRLEPEFGGKLSDAAIIHCNGPLKPWQPNFDKGARRDLYWKHRRLTGGLLRTRR
ncbi:glycosyltransferase family 8 protein [Polymorphospora rubra]|uniref:glycosyltransferase family 8 protein n=1 Tax=Polymorphospora rubra TaxID=338584 RepID=UPI0033D5D728